MSEIVTEYPVCKIWQFTMEQIEKSTQPGVSNRVKEHKRSIGVLSTNMDDAYAEFRKHYPNHRICDVVRHDIPVHHFVQTPESVAMANRLEK